MVAGAPGLGAGGGDDVALAAPGAAAGVPPARALGPLTTKLAPEAMAAVLPEVPGLATAAALIPVPVPVLSTGDCKPGADALP